MGKISKLLSFPWPSNLGHLVTHCSRLSSPAGKHTKMTSHTPDVPSDSLNNAVSSSLQPHQPHFSLLFGGRGGGGYFHVDTSSKTQRPASLHKSRIQCIRRLLAFCWTNIRPTAPPIQEVHQLAASHAAFAAVKADGRVVTWGHPEHGGDSSGAQEQLRRGRGGWSEGGAKETWRVHWQTADDFLSCQDTILVASGSLEGIEQPTNRITSKMQRTLFRGGCCTLHHISSCSCFDVNMMTWPRLQAGAAREI